MQNELSMSMVIIFDELLSRTQCYLGNEYRYQYQTVVVMTAKALTCLSAYDGTPTKLRAHSVKYIVGRQNEVG